MCTNLTRKLLCVTNDPLTDDVPDNDMRRYGYNLGIIIIKLGTVTT